MNISEQTRVLYQQIMGFRFALSKNSIVIIPIYLLCAPSWAGPPFVTDDPEPVDYQHWEVYAFSTATSVTGDTAGFLPGMEINYGALPNLQLHVIIPLAFDALSGAGTRFGLGDLELGAKYRLVDQDRDTWAPEVGIFPLVELPAGNAGRGLGAGRTQAYFPVWLQKDFGDWTTYGGGGYWINPDAGRRNYGFIGWLLQRQITKQFALGAEVFHRTPMTNPGRPSSGYNIGGIYDVNEHYHILFSAGRGFENGRAMNCLSYYFGLQKTFRRGRPSGGRLRFLFAEQRVH